MDIPTISIPGYVLSAYSTLVSNGYQAYIVGGSVRDVLQRREPKDWDITTNANPEEIQKIFEETFYENEFGTVGVVFKSEIKDAVVEVTTYRSEGEYSDFRRPDKVEWGKSIEEDLERRDFTINAIAMSIDSKFLATHTKDSTTDLFAEVPLHFSDYSLVDPYNGLEDIGNRVIRAVRDPLERFREDALRMLRAIRFAAQLEFTIEQKTLQAIIETSVNIQHISGERIRDELFKILASNWPYEGIKLLDGVGLLEYIFPELVAGKGLDQRGHHKHDVFIHSLEALKHCPSKDPIVRLATLLHDIGKVPTHEVRDGINTFYNHDIVGGKLVSQIAHRLHLSKKQREKLFTLVRYHMFSVDTIQTDSAIRRFIRKVGIENISDMVDLRIGDRLGSGTKDAEGWRLKEFKNRIEQLLMPTFTVKDLAINGNDVMRILNISAGPKIGQVLNQLFEEVLDDPQKNTKEYLTQRVHAI